MDKLLMDVSEANTAWLRDAEGAITFHAERNPNNGLWNGSMTDAEFVEAYRNNTLLQSNQAPMILSMTYWVLGYDEILNLCM